MLIFRAAGFFFPCKGILINSTEKISWCNYILDIHFKRDDCNRLIAITLKLVNSLRRGLTSVVNRDEVDINHSLSLFFLLLHSFPSSCKTRARAFINKSITNSLPLSKAFIAHPPPLEKIVFRFKKYFFYVEIKKKKKKKRSWNEQSMLEFSSTRNDFLVKLPSH